MHFHHNLPSFNVQHSQFFEAKHGIGIPCFQFQDGSLSLDIDEVLKRAESAEA